MTDLIPALADAAGLAQSALRPAFLVFLRVGGVMAVAPGFAEGALPQRFRLIVALALTAVVAPVIGPRFADGGFLLPGLAETLAGLTIGVGLRLMVMGLQMAGAIAAQTTSLSAIFSPAGAEAQPALSTALTMAGLAVAMHLGLHVDLVRLIIASYDVVGPGVAAPARDAALWGVALVGRVFALGFRLAAPLVLAGLCYNLAMGLANRALPQLMLSVVAAPALALGGLAGVALLAPMIVRIWVAAFQTYLASPFGPAP